MRQSAIAQWTFDALLRTSRHNAAGRVRWGLFSKLRSLLIRAGDPLVSYELDGTRLLMPLSHGVPVFRVRLPEYSANVARIAALAKIKYPDLRFIDVGANVGDTVATVRRLAQFPILCIEGSNRYFAILEANFAHVPDVHLAKAFLDTSTGDAQGILSGSGGTAHLSAAQTDASQLHSTRITESKTLSDVLAAHPLFQTAKMLKVDTDGFDGRILHGAKDFIAAAKPLVFFEYDPYFLALQQDSGITIFDRLREAGYTRAIVYENVGDYLLTADIGDTQLIEDMHQFYSGRSGKRYADVCAFHAEDADLCSEIRAAELQHFQRVRADGAALPTGAAD